MLMFNRIERVFLEFYDFEMIFCGRIQEELNTKQQQQHKQIKEKKKFKMQREHKKNVKKM